VRRASLLGAAAALAVGARGLAAQDCRPPAGSNEARLLAFYSAPVAFSPAAAPGRRPPGALSVAFEVAPVPVPPSGLEQTSYCYAGAVQRSRLAPALPRPRVTVALPAGLALEGSYLPPVTVADATPNLASLALSATRVVRGGAADSAAAGSRRGAAVVTAMLRAQGTFGSVKGPITCPRSGLQRTDPVGRCYGTEPSHDTFHPDMAGLEGALAAHRGGGRLGVYAGGGVTWLEPRFQVGFRDGNGALDQTRIRVSLTRATVFGGATYRLGRAVDLSAQVYSVPVDATTFRFAAAYELR
jgi:hypothetical protein